MNTDFSLQSSFNRDSPLLSIVIPMFNEEGNISPLLESLHREIRKLNISYEVILIDDGSFDKTWEYIKEFASIDKKVKGVHLSRNFGHQYALLAGLSSTSGKAIISMDGDLQHPPALIKDLIDAWFSGYKIVNTIRIDHDETSLFKRLTSRYFYRAFSSLSGVNLSAGSSDFRLLDRQVLQSILLIGGSDTFLRGIVQWVGFSTTCISYRAGQRFSGHSKYTLKKMIRFASQGIISFSTKPLRIGIWIGSLTSILAFLELVYIVIRYLQGYTVQGWASTVGLLSLLFGILFIMLGIMGTYLASIHNALQRKPKFIISEVVNIENNLIYHPEQL